MVWAAPALAAALCLRVSTDLVKATAARGCDPEPGTIPASDPDVLEGAQQDALNALLLSGYGDPSSWDSQTLQDLGPLVNQTTLSLVPEAAREDLRRSIAASHISQGRSQREKSLPLLRVLAAAAAGARLERSAAGCQSEPITASNIDDTVPFLTPEELDLCLSSDVLIENLEAVLGQPITTNTYPVLKKKVDEYFQSGIPEEQLRRLGPLSRLYTVQEISQWPLTCSDTLLELLDPSGGEWNDSQVQQLLSTYLAQGGSLTGPLLQRIGEKHLCELQEEQIQQIPAEAIETAGQLNISSCSQTKKEQLYGKAREAFANLASTPGLYYCQIRPYLGGAPAEDLKELANAGVPINMDLDTFLSLNPQELQKLSVTDVKNLLGENLSELKQAEHEPLVVSWVQKQSQQALDCVLGIGLQGGLPEPMGTASPAATSPASVTSMATTPVPTTSASVTSMATTPVPTTSASVTSMVTTPVPTTSATVTSMATTPVPTTSASVTSMATTPVPTTSTAATPVPHTPTPIPSSTISPTTGPCQPSSPPASPSPSPGNVPEPPPPTSNGYINLEPAPGSGSRLCSCLVPVLAATMGSVLLLGGLL
ncbi:mesothelin-like protein [Poecile atricapillus]|uniref:mesothelin-like protein n=1 Tax=Poecile atricapillus TaxID=48891 RepID=UPI0027397C8B|nr:mesothelin-like protein [Poecile atricapillus]